MKITGYMILQTNYLGGLEEVVQQAIGKGWQPLGGVSIAFLGDKGITRYSQAVVQYEEEK